MVHGCQYHSLFTGTAVLVTAGMLTSGLAATACAVGCTLLPLAPQAGAIVSALMLAGLATPV
jgi:hypothetical protein